MKKNDWRDLDKNVMPVFLRVVNPVNKPVSNRESDETLAQLKAKGYDGTIAQEDGTETEYAVFNPTQIKSATGNNGNFDPSNANIYNQSSDMTSQIFKKRGSMKKVRGHYKWIQVPNSKPTHLTEEQWLQVRTPSFNRWF